MRIEFDLGEHTANLHVQLLDNPGVKVWADKFATGHTTSALLHDHMYVREPDFDHLDKAYQDIDTSLYILGRINMHYSGPELQSFLGTDPQYLHQCLNSLHRFFTTNQAQCNDKKLGSVNYPYISQVLDQINQAVHIIELYVPRIPEDQDLDRIEEIKLYTATESNNSSWCNLESYQEFHSEQFYDVILTSEVLGKTVLQSYLDNDDPNHWDTSGHYCSAGGLQICLTPVRQQIYQSAGFESWLIRNGVSRDKLKFDFPIGNIVNKHSHDWNMIMDHLQTSFHIQQVRYYPE